MDKKNKDFTYEFIGNDRVLIRNFFTLTPAGIQAAGKIVKNYATEVTDDQVETKDDGFIVRDFRIASDTIFWNYGMPYDYGVTPGLLKNAVNIFYEPVTLFKDHWWLTDNIVGQVRNIRYQEKDGETTGGINGSFYVDSIVDSRLARNVETGSANRCSVTWLIQVKQSHKDMERNEFLDQLGQTIDDEMVRFIVADILEVYEISLVWYGADSTAKQLTQNTKIPGTHRELEVNMDKQKLLELLKKNGFEVTEDQFETELGKILSQNKALADKVTQLETEISENKLLVTVAQNARKKVVESIQTAIKVVNGKVTELEQAVLDNASYDQLLKHQSEWLEKKEAKAPLVCPNCKVPYSRRSSHEEAPPETPAETTVNHSLNAPYYGKPLTMKGGLKDGKN